MDDSREDLKLLVAQLCGIIAAVAVVHVLVLVSLGDRLVEGPAQIMNDAVLLATTMGCSWSFISRGRMVRALLPLVSCAALCLYAASMAWWHVDPFPGLEVQRYVVGQVVSTSSALFILFIGGLV